MIEGLIEVIATWTINLISQFQYLGIFLAMAIESASIPLPSEIIMPFSGFLVSEGKLNFLAVVIAGAAGNLFGSIIMYLFGILGQETVVRKFVRGWGKILITEDELNRGEAWFRKYGDWIVFGSRILPVVRTFISLPAGVSQVPFIRFCALTFLGSFIWSALLAYIGVVMGENWQILEGTFRKFDILIVALGIILFVGYIYHKYKQISVK